MTKRVSFVLSFSGLPYGADAGGFPVPVNKGMKEDGTFQTGTDHTTADRITFCVDWDNSGDWEAVDFIYMVTLKKAYGEKGLRRQQAFFPRRY